MKKLITTILSILAINITAHAGTILIDFGTTGAGWYGGASVVGADARGNYWNSVTSGTYYPNLVDTTGAVTSVGGFGFLTGMTFSSYNGPAGATSTPLTQAQLDATVFTADAGIFGVKEVLVDYIKTATSIPKVQWVVNGLDASSLYNIKFYGSAKYQNDYATRMNVYSDNTFATSSLLATTVANFQSPTQSWVINTTDIGVLRNLPTTGSLYFEIQGANGGTGLINAMSIETVVIPEPNTYGLLMLGFLLIWIMKTINKTKAGVLVALIAICSLAHAHAQLLINWDLPTSSTNRSVVSNFNETGLSSSTIEMASGITPSSISNAWGGISWTSGGTDPFNNATTNNDYFAFSITANSGYQVTINGVSNLGIQVSASGPRYWHLLYSTTNDNGAFINPLRNYGPFEVSIPTTSTLITDITNALNASFAANPITISEATGYFRLVGYGGAVSSGSGRIAAAGTNDFGLVGSVYTIPEPSIVSLALVGLLALRKKIYENNKQN